MQLTDTVIGFDVNVCEVEIHLLHPDTRKAVP